MSTATIASAAATPAVSEIRFTCIELGREVQGGEASRIEIEDPCALARQAARVSLLMQLAELGCEEQSTGEYFRHSYGFAITKPKHIESALKVLDPSVYSKAKLEDLGFFVDYLYDED